MPDSSAALTNQLPAVLAAIGIALVGAVLLYRVAKRRRALLKQSNATLPRAPGKNSGPHEQLKHIFTKGSRYRVKQDVQMGPSKFRAGEEVIFETVSYVPYDSSFVYGFSSTGEGMKYWMLHDEAPIDTWTLYFESL